MVVLFFLTRMPIHTLIFISPAQDTMNLKLTTSYSRTDSILMMVEEFLLCHLAHCLIPLAVKAALPRPTSTKTVLRTFLSEGAWCQAVIRKHPKVFFC